MIRILPLFLPVFIAAVPGGEPEAGRVDPWLATSQYRFNDAHALFEDTGGSQAGDRAQRLGRAVALLNRAPRTDSSIATSAQELQGLVDEGPLDEIGITARYLLARIAGVHVGRNSPAVAAPRLRALLDEMPEHPLAQHGGVKLCLLLLYDPAVAPEPDFAAAEEVLERLTLNGPRRDGHVALGRAYLYFRREPQRALAHLRAAFDLGLQLGATQASIGLSIAEVAAEHGQNDLARTHYEKFLHANPRDVRAQLVRDRLAAIVRVNEERPAP